MQDQIRRAIIDLTLLSQTVSCSERIRVLETVNRFRKALVGFRGDGERAQATSASIKEPSKAFPRLRAL